MPTSYVHGVNYEGAYCELDDEGLFDCSTFLQQYGFNIKTSRCTGRERAFGFRNILLISRPGFLI